MSGKVVFIVGVLGVGGYFGHKAMSYDASVYDLPKDQVVNILTEAKTTLPRRDGPGQIEIWSVGPSEDGVELNMRYAEWAPTLECDAVVTEVEPGKTKVVPNCATSASKSGSAIARTEDELRTPMFAEHIESILNKRPFDRSRVDSAEMASVFKNLPAMQGEALKRSAEMQKMQAEASNH